MPETIPPRVVSTRDAMHNLEEALSEFRACKNAENIARRALEHAEARTGRSKANVDALRATLDKSIAETTR